MTSFYGWGSTASRLQSHYEETVSFLSFNSQVSRSSSYSIDCPRKDERLSWPWSQPVVSNLGPLDWESSTLALGHCIFQLATMRRRNHFPIFLSLAVKCENKLLKVYCVSKLYLQKFTSLKYHHPHRPWKAFLFLQVISFVDFTLKYKTKLQHAWFSLLKGWWGVPSLVESLFIPLHQENCPHQIFIPQTK